MTGQPCACDRPACRLPARDHRHGTTNGYSNLGCGCTRCRAAWAEYTRKIRAAREGSLAPDDDRHGLPSTYQNWRCRCVLCTEAQARSHQDYVDATREATGSA